MISFHFFTTTVMMTVSVTHRMPLSIDILYRVCDELRTMAALDFCSLALVNHSTAPVARQHILVLDVQRLSSETRLKTLKDEAICFIVREKHIIRWPQSEQEESQRDINTLLSFAKQSDGKLSPEWTTITLVDAPLPQLKAFLSARFLIHFCYYRGDVIPHRQLTLEVTHYACHKPVFRSRNRPYPRRLHFDTYQRTGCLNGDYGPPPFLWSSKAGHSEITPWTFSIRQSN
jgi:hypothetical protein